MGHPNTSRTWKQIHERQASAARVLNNSIAPSSLKSAEVPHTVMVELQSFPGMGLELEEEEGRPGKSGLTERWTEVRQGFRHHGYTQDPHAPPIPMEASKRMVCVMENGDTFFPVTA
jgi:hypothetical protein